MSFLSFIPLVLNALVAIPKIGDMVMSAVSAVVLWWANKQTSETLADIIDAANLASRAQTQEERFAAAAAWQKALSRPKEIA